ncbi:hypothetical protein IT575_00260 [bacterium]|nr:hypothetical protein [bacterium]
MWQFPSSRPGGQAQALVSAALSTGAFGYLLGFIVPSLGRVYLDMEMPMPPATRLFYELCRFPLPLVPILLMIGLATYGMVRMTAQSSTSRMVALLLTLSLMLLLIGLAMWAPVQGLRTMIEHLD